MAFSSIDLAALRSWWDSFTAAEKELFKATFGGIASLLPVVVTEGFLQAVCRFWCPSLNLFRFGMNELTPSPEEYHRFLRMRSSLDELAQLTPRVSPRTALSRMTGIKRTFMPKEAVGEIPVVSVEFLTGPFEVPGVFDHDCFIKPRNANDPALILRRIHAFGFILLAGLFFPRDDGRLDMRVALYVDELIAGKTIIPIIVAEIFRSLTKCQLSPNAHFGGCIELLFVWLVGHVVQHGLIRPQWFNGIPIDLFIKRQGNLKDMPGNFQRWLSTFESLTPDTIVWNLGLVSDCSVSLAGLGLSFLPLVGLFGVVPYFGARITRQFGVIQEIPPDVSILPSTRFCFDFPLSRADPLIQEAEAYWGEREVLLLKKVLDKPPATTEYSKWIQEQIAPNVGTSTVRPQSVTQCGKKKTETLEQTRAGLREQINTLQAALNDARGTESSTSTLTALEDSLATAESERDRLTRECLLLQEETMTLRESMPTLRGQFDALTLEREGLQQQLVATQQAHGIERDQFVTMTTQLRSELSFAHGFYPSGELDVSLVQSFLAIVENLSAVDTSGNVDEHTLLQYYRNALLVFQSILNGFAGGNP
ncbi:hypothetical protein Vadar_031687 [Vaccinium darrowii]|uniref:Uncharacterized protein n=1 Tax=Vaccinium darrowii TaxID=229202 RepID=A0ACB7X5K2_9ERIC|nr:hypothetical protein Vadar_031687 [Vaccinium darrowii]